LLLHVVFLGSGRCLAPLLAADVAVAAAALDLVAAIMIAAVNSMMSMCSMHEAFRP